MPTDAIIPPLRSLQLMLPTLAPIHSRPGWIYELKYDGYRLLAARSGGEIRLQTRNRNDATAWYPAIVDSLRDLPGRWIIDGELCAIDERGIPDFEALRGLRGRAAPVALYPFDLVFLQGRDWRTKPLLERKERLRKLIPLEHTRIGYVSYIEERGEDLYRHALAIGMEGVVGKKADSRYVGGRTQLWLKSKPEDHHDGWKRPRRTSAPP